MSQQAGFDPPIARVHHVDSGSTLTIQATTAGCNIQEIHFLKLTIAKIKM